jgi:acetate kinase
VVDSSNDAKPVIQGLFDRLGSSDSTLKVKKEGGESVTTSVGNLKLSNAVSMAVKQCSQLGQIAAVGCRVVHGGSRFEDPVVTDSMVVDAIRELAPLAPLHNARDVETIEAAHSALPGIPVIAIFDTGFHRTLPDVAKNYALPKNVVEKYQIQRYGFHGISYRYVSNRLTAQTGSRAHRLIVCHLGSGASICAIQDGKSIDTSMGMTPLEGLVMGTRSGDVDPGLILFLQREMGMSYAEVDKMLNHASGLAGMSGLGGDVRMIEKAAADGNQSAELALEVFCYRVAKYIGAYSVALEGIDALAFCGGIGENSPDIRKRICRRLGFLGIEVNETLNEVSNPSDVFRIDERGKVPVWVVKTDEERQIAIETFEAVRHLRLSSDPLTQN